MTNKQWLELLQEIANSGLLDGYEVKIRLLDQNGLVSIKSNGSERAFRLGNRK